MHDKVIYTVFFLNRNQIVTKVNVLAIKENCFFMLCNEIFGKKANKQTKHKKMKNTSCFLSCMNMKIIVCYILEESLDNLTSTFPKKEFSKPFALHQMYQKRLECRQ